MLHEPLRYWPAGQLIVQLEHEVTVTPLLGWYVLAGQPTHDGVVVLVQLPERYVPALHVVTQVLQKVCAPATFW